MRCHCCQFVLGSPGTSSLHCQALALFETSGPVGDLSQSDIMEFTRHCLMIVIIITRVSGQVHCAYSCKSTLVQDKQDTTRRPVI